jgi:cytochrome b561
MSPETELSIERYTLPAIVLHWLLAMALIGMFGIGLFMADLPISPLRLKLYNWHKWAGITVLALSLLLSLIHI